MTPQETYGLILLLRRGQRDLPMSNAQRTRLGHAEKALIEAFVTQMQLVTQKSEDDG
jgi:hypothetical protein